jgi:hypothetical protein
MTRKFLSPIDLTQNELQNPRFQNLAAAPGSPAVGQFYYNTTSGRFEFRGAAGWIDPTARVNHTGTQLAATISDFAAQVQANRLDQMAVPTAALNINNQRLTNLANAVSAQDAVTLAQLQSVQNGTDWKASVRAIATTNITLSGAQTIDGVSLIAGDRVAVVGQTTATQNGIYVVAAGAWSRATDADSSAEVTPNLSFFVEEGTSNADTQWRLTTNGPIVLGTTNLSFAQIGAGTSYTNGTGISIAGSVISVDTTVVVRKAAATIGDGSATSFTVTHSLGTLDVQVQVFENATGDTVECGVRRISTTQVQLFGFTVAPAVGALRVVVQG